MTVEKKRRPSARKIVKLLAQRADLSDQAVVNAASDWYDFDGDNIRSDVLRAAIDRARDDHNILRIAQGVSDA